MRTNLELALLDVLSASAPTTTPTEANTSKILLSTVICAYIRIAGFAEPTQALTSFARALDKHAEYPEKSSLEQARWARMVSDLRRDYWKDVLSKNAPARRLASDHTSGNASQLFACPCCGKLGKREEIIKALNLEEDGEGQSSSRRCEAEDTPNASKKRTRKVKRRVQTRKAGKKLAFDPYSPSTSKVSM